MSTSATSVDATLGPSEAAESSITNVNSKFISSSSASSSSLSTFAHRSNNERAVHWFRKGLRLHDNPALLHAANHSSALYPVFVMDPWFINESKIGLNRMQFLLESLHDLHRSLQMCGSRLIVLLGKPEDVLVQFIKDMQVTKLTFETDTEPYARVRDAKIRQLVSDIVLDPLPMHGIDMSSNNTSAVKRETQTVEVIQFVSHTLFDLDTILKRNQGQPPLTYSKFLSLIGAMPKPLDPLPAPIGLPPALEIENVERFLIPTLADLKYPELQAELVFHGGETVALDRMKRYLADTKKVLTFSKPDSSPTALDEPSTTVLSPYLKFGCLSPRMFYQALQKVYCGHSNHTQPPVSLLGQLYWREFFYAAAYGTPNFDKMAGNPVCRIIDWDTNNEFLSAWSEGRTGYPWIDACMIQLRTMGWMHHLARHAVACFLTRGDLYLSWEVGRDVFDRYLLDADWSLNNANWMWLSASAFFHAYYRVYSPITFAQKYDPEGNFIRRFVPQLRNFPAKYIYAPWTAPLSLQKQYGCIIGQDYPHPIVDHEVASKVNMGRMKYSYSNQPTAAACSAVSAIAMLSKGNSGSTSVPNAAARVSEHAAKLFMSQYPASHEASSQPVLNSYFHTVKKEEQPSKRDHDSTLQTLQSNRRKEKSNSFSSISDDDSLSEGSVHLSSSDSNGEGGDSHPGPATKRSRRDESDEDDFSGGSTGGFNGSSSRSLQRRSTVGSSSSSSSSTLSTKRSSPSTSNATNNSTGRQQKNSTAKISGRHMYSKSKPLESRDLSKVDQVIDDNAHHVASQSDTEASVRLMMPYSSLPLPTLQEYHRLKRSSHNSRQKEHDKEEKDAENEQVRSKSIRARKGAVESKPQLQTRPLQERNSQKQRKQAKQTKSISSNATQSAPSTLRTAAAQQSAEGFKTRLRSAQIKPIVRKGRKL